VQRRPPPDTGCLAVDVGLGEGHVVDQSGVDPGPFEHRLDRGGGEFLDGDGPQAPAERAHRGPHRGDDRCPATSGHLWSSVQSAAAAPSAARWSGWAIAIIRSRRRARFSPRRSATPYSVTITPVSARDRPAGPLSRATMRLAVPAVDGPAVEGSASTGTPPADRAAPRRKSAAPPVPPT